MKKKTILVVESSEMLFQINFNKLLNDGRLEFIRASTTQDAMKKFEESGKKIDLVVTEAHALDQKLDSATFIKNIVKSKFCNPIIVYYYCSIDPREFQKAGATHVSDRDRIVDLVIELFEL